MKVQLPVRQAILKRQTFEANAEDRAGMLCLDLNENTSGCSAAAKRALGRLTSKQIALYPPYRPATRALGRYFRVSADEVLLANGGDDALRVIFDTFVDAGSRILICEPTFPMYRFYAEIFDAEVTALRYGPQMEFPLAEILIALEQSPRALFIANPNNPTGTLLPLSAIETILQAATGTVVVIDEAYAEFSGVTAVPWIQRYPQLFVLRTFSKAAGLAALRLGALIACADSVSLLRRAMPPFPVNLAALAAAEATIGEKNAMRNYVRENSRVHRWFEQELNKSGVTTFPSAGNFLLADFGAKGGRVFQALRRADILVRPRPDIGAGFARITIGTQKEMERVVKTVRPLLSAGRPR